MNRRELLKYSTLFIGTSLSSSIIAGVTSAEKLHSGAKKSLLNPHQCDLVDTLSELIIPTTDTPGAIDAGVPAFIDLMVSDWQREPERSSFLRGLTMIDRYCSEHFQRDFLKCTENQQISALTVFEKSAKAEEATGDIKPFFTVLRELVVVGYFTSKVGATQALRHAHAPGAFIGDYPLKDVDKAWAPIY